MKEYYIIQNNERKGPFKKEEIKKMELNNNTPIWYDGISDWKKLSDLKKFNKAKRNKPPVFKKNHIDEKVNINLKKNETANEFVKIFKLLKYSIYIGIIIFLYFSITKNGFSYLFETKNINWSQARDVLGYIPSAFVKENLGDGFVEFIISDANYSEVKYNVVSEIFKESLKNALILTILSFLIILTFHYLIYLVKWTLKHSNK